jgi:glyoxylase-like metal-dependent hydrolase (beta-lactamase superfamily II)
MFKRAPLEIRLCLIGLMATTPVIAISAQDRQEQAPLTAGSGDVVFGADLVKTGLYLITGGGGNSLLRLSASGSILVDGNLPGTYRAQMSQVRKISKLSDLPVRVLVITDHHENHAGNRAQFEAAGIPVIAQENTKQRLLASSAAAENSIAGKAPAPTVDYDRDYKLRMGGIEVQLFHFGNACTNGDTVVYFRDLKVVAVGDLFTTDTPDPDYPAGGSLVGWGPVIAQVLKLDFAVAVPGKGQMVTRTELEGFKTRIDRLVSRARRLVKNGVAKDQLMAQLETDDLGWRLDFTGDQLDGFYAELSRAR